MKPTFRRTPLAAAILATFALPAVHPVRADEESTDIATAPTQLPGMEVTGDREPAYAPDASTIGGKNPTPLKDIPQTVNVLTRPVLDAQNATTLSDALRNVPGITLTSGEGGQIGDNVNLRGFTARTDIYLDGMRDRGQYKRDTFALESVEVLKGPSSLFFGRGSTGGVINQVSKTPQARDHKQVSLSLGTDDWYRSTADFNHVISDHAAVRVAAMVQDVKSTREVVQNQDWGLAPSLKLALGTDTDLLLYGLAQHNRDIPDYGIPFAFGQPAAVASHRFYGHTDDYFDQDALVGKVRLDHRFTPWLTLRNQFQASENKLRARPTPYRVCTATFDSPAGSCPVPAAGAAPDQITIQSDRRDRDLVDTSIFDQLDLIANFGTGTLRHALIGGIEVGRDETDNQGYTWTPRVTDNLGTFTPGPSPASMTRTRNATHVEGSAETFGVYLNETLSIGAEWKLIAGVRHDRFEAEARTLNNSDGSIANQTTGAQAGQPNAFARSDHGTSVRVGVVWQPQAEHSYYVAYGTSFNPSAEAVTISAAQSSVGPEKTRSYELGAKWDLLGGDLALSTALFRVQKYDARTTDAGVVTLDGNTLVQGFELGAVGRITRDWQLIGGYTLLDSELVDSRDAIVPVPGQSVPPGSTVKGNQLANTPQNSGSVWSSWRFLHNFEAGAGVYYVDRRFITNSNVSSVDEYVRADAMLAFHQPVYDVQLNVQNLLDEDYYDAIVQSENGRAVPGRGMTAVVTGTLKF